MPNKNTMKAMKQGKGGGMGASHSRSFGEVTRATPSKSQGGVGGSMEHCRGLGEVTRATPSKRQ